MVVTRFAPSPTGHLHIGGIRSALYPYALAKKWGGKFILRIEDTDQKRKVEGGEQAIMDDLKAFGMEWDGLYRQSERLDIYHEYAHKLVGMGHAYYSFETKEELEKARELAAVNKQVFHYRSADRDLDSAVAKKRVEAGESFVIRLRTPDAEDLHYEDAVQGKMKFNTRDVDDTVLLKSDGFPTYHLAVAVDDHLMGVTHVLRGFGWIPSIPKHILIYRAFGWEMPVHAHLTDILNPGGHGKLSKRHGDVSARAFLQKGYLPDAMLNFLMLLGWSSPEERVHGEAERELFSLQDFIDIFDLKNVNKANQEFHYEKLDWFNKQYIRALNPDAFTTTFSDWMHDYAEGDDRGMRLHNAILEKGPDFLQQALVLIQERVTTLSEVPEAIACFYFMTEQQDLTSFKQLANMSVDDTKEFLKVFLEMFRTVPDLAEWPHDEWELFMRRYADDHGRKAGEIFMTLRVVVTDSPVSPPLFEMMQMLGREEVEKRISRYL